ncbi:hypothetical protein BMH30_07860, partial [Leucobacter sp. OLES1]
YNPAVPKRFLNSLVLVVALGLPLGLTAPSGDTGLMAAVLLSSAFGFLIAANSGWAVSFRYIPVMLAACAAASLLSGPWWPVVIGAVALAAGLAQGAGWGMPVAAAGVIACSMAPSAPDAALGLRLVVLAAGAVYAAVVARALGLPRLHRASRVGRLRSTVSGVGFAAIAGLAAALSHGLPQGYWLPATVFAVVMPSAGMSLQRRAVQRIAGTLLGAAIALGISLLEPPQAAVLAVILLCAYLICFFLRPLWLITTLVTTALMLLLSGSRDIGGIAESRVLLTITGIVLVLAGAGAGWVMSRAIPRSVREYATHEVAPAVTVEAPSADAEVPPAGAEVPSEPADRPRR